MNWQQEIPRRPDLAAGQVVLRAVAGIVSGFPSSRHCAFRQRVRGFWVLIAAKVMRATWHLLVRLRLPRAEMCGTTPSWAVLSARACALLAPPRYLLSAEGGYALQDRGSEPAQPRTTAGMLTAAPWFFCARENYTKHGDAESRRAY